MVLRQAPAMAWKFLLHALKNVKKPTISKNAIKLVTEAGNKLVTLPNTAFSKNYFLRINLFETNARYNPHLNQFSYGNCLSFYTVGEYIHKGCDGAVYELKRNEDTEYDLAVKKLFNYHSQRRSSRQLWEENKLEIIPLVELPSDVNFNNNINKVRRIPKKHANIIDIKTAFVDDIPYLKDSHVHFPEAQRFYEDYDGVVHNVRTIFIVMKRYKMDFAEYNRLFRVRSPRCNTILYGQLIESLCFLHSCTISHRDIKLDNILIEFENEKDVPFLVLADFGYSLSTGDWNVCHRRNVSLGGNFPFRAPEIACSKAGPNVTVNFEKADSWSAGALGYDFFGCAQPFVGIMTMQCHSLKGPSDGCKAALHEL
uniref:Protein kinase domain-containing protein n=1 Tax=Rhabditophanes sp. KR3021 TaxID=114890 RepID=A0AC35TXE8_9BILA